MPYVPSNDPAVLNAAQNIAGILDGNIDTDVGQTAYAALMNDNSLTGRQKQAVCCEVGRHVVDQGMQVAGDHPDTLLRESSAGTGFMTAAMNDMGARYIEAVKDKALTSGQQHGLANENMVAKEIATSVTDQKHKLSADACEFMSACEAGIPDDMNANQQEVAKRTLEANTLLLRGVTPAIVKARADVVNDPNASQAKKDASLATFNAGRAVQQFANYMKSDFAVADDDAPLAATVHLMQDNALKQQFTNTMSSMGAGDYNQLQQGAHMSVKDSLKQAMGKDTHSKLAQATAKLDTRQNKLNTLVKQQKDDQLTKNLRVESLAANANNQSVSGAQIQQGLHTVREMQEADKKLTGKIQNQQQKVEHSKARVDDLKTRIGRR